jgi:hypothetical protein
MKKPVRLGRLELQVPLEQGQVVTKDLESKEALFVAVTQGLDKATVEGKLEWWY